MIYKRYFFEEWRDIYDYEGLYQISNYGRVKSLKFGKERFLKQAENGRGYLIVVLFKDGKGKTCSVHQLVAQHFVQKTSLFDNQVNHKDENKKNNIWLNLEWCTNEYNSNYGTRNERIVKANKERGNYERLAILNKKILTNRKDQSKLVLQINKTTGEAIKEFESIHQVERELGFSQSAICNCCLGKQKSAYGYYWRYKDVG